uniref:HMA domain-containing protein n=1 Tax=Aegilops tauschii subsp. strangulata TaxID=200361 RepID=A0A453B1V2_AEGTS
WNTPALHSVIIFDLRDRPRGLGLRHDALLSGSYLQGMMCDGCAASVKRILESQPEVTSATVDYKEARAVVWTTPEVKVAEDWQKQCGEKLASHLGTCGFESRPQGMDCL